MKVSIVIPAHNEESSLARAIRFASEQDYGDYEVIVVNNASTDRTEEIARSFANVTVVNESRKGLLWAREAGRLAASGDIIANMDADCVPDSDWLRRGTRWFRDKRVSAISGPYDYHDSGRAFRYAALYTQMTIYWLMARIVQLPVIRVGAVMIGGNSLIRADALQKAGGYNTALTFYGEDTDTAKRMSRFGRVLFSNQLVMKTSARRFQAEGIVSLQVRYLKYFFKTILGDGANGTHGADRANEAE